VPWGIIQVLIPLSVVPHLGLHFETVKLLR